MQVKLALYDALVRANIPQPAARAVVEALEKDMDAVLATKADFATLRAEFSAVRADFGKLESFVKLTAEATRAHIGASEARLVMKLGAVIVATATVAAAVLHLVSH